MPAKKRYEYKIALGKKIDGTSIRKSFYSTKSKRDAKRKAEEYAETYKLNLLLGEPEKTKTITFEKWAIRCLELYKMAFDPPLWKKGGSSDSAGRDTGVHQQHQRKIRTRNNKKGL